MRKNSIFINNITPFVFSLLISTCFADSDCIYDKNSIAPPAFDKRSFLWSVWDTETKEFQSILKAGGYIYIRYWRCTHDGIKADLIIPYFRVNDENIKEKVLWLGKHLLHKADFNVLQSALLKNKVNNDFKIDLSEVTAYDAFSISIDTVSDFTIMSLYLYRS